MMKYFIYLIAFFLPILASAQTNNDPVYINYSVFPNSKMDKLDEEASLQILEANVILPKFNLSEKTEVYTNINFKSYFYNYENKSIGMSPDQLNDLRVGLIVRHKFNEDWEMILSPRVNLRTDFSDDYTKHGVFPSVNLIGIKNSEKVKNLSYGLGVTYNNDLNKNTILPLGYLKYENDDIRVYTILPSFAYVMLTPSDKFEYGLSYNLDATISHIENNSTTERNYFKASNITIAPTIGYNFAGKFWLNAKAGYAMFRRYQFLDSDFDDLALSEDNKFKSGLFFGIGVRLRLQ